MEKKAEYLITSSFHEGIPEIIVKGNARGDNFFKMLNDVDTMLKADASKKALFDIRSLDKHVRFLEIYRFVRAQPFFIFNVEAAVVDVPENTPLGIAVKNAGLPWEWFNDIDEARAWLKIK